MKPIQPQHTTVFLLLSFLVPLLMAALSCDAIGNPNSSTPGDAYDSLDDAFETPLDGDYYSQDELWAECQERAWKIDDWAGREEDQVWEEWLESGGTTWSLSGAKEQVRKDAARAKAQLYDRCHGKALNYKFPRDLEYPGLPTQTPPKFAPTPTLGRPGR